MKFPAIPWKQGEESFAKFQESLHHGHGVAGYKCLNCSLEFVVFTWRTEEEAKKALAENKMICPECGEKKAGFCGYRRWPGPIFEQFAQLCHDE